MAGPGVQLAEVDLSTRVPSFPGAYGGIVIPAKKGPVNDTTLVTSITQLLDRYTPNGTIEVGMDSAYWSAIAFLQKSMQLWVSRAASNPLYGGAFIRPYGSTKDNDSVEFGFSDPTKYDLDTANGRSLIAPSQLNVDISVNVNDLQVDATFYALCQTGDKITVSGSNLPSPLVEGTTYYIIKTSTPKKLLLATSLANITTNTIITFTTTGEGTITDIEVSSENSSDTKCLLLYGANEGNWNNDVFIRLYPYRETEVISQPALNQIEVVQNWEIGEAVRLSTTGLLPVGLDSSATYYIASSGSPTSRKLSTTLTDAFVGNTIIWEDDTGNGNVTLVPVDEKCKEPDCFALEVFTSQNLSNPVETFICSRVEGKKDGYGNGVYVEDALLASNYIRAINNKTVDSSIMPKAQFTLKSFDNGSDGGPITDGTMLRALEPFQNVDKVNVTLMMDGGWTTPAYQKQGLLALCENRKDCVAILSTRYSDENNSDYINAVTDYRKMILNANSSYGGIYGPHVLIYDQYNNRQIFVPPDGFVAACISETAANQEIWYPPAGFRRGILNVIDVKRRYTSDRAGNGELGYLYDNGINSIRFFPGKGIVIWGQKTLCARPSSLDRMNVRLLLIVIEPAIAESLMDYVFQLNDPAERKLIVSIIESYMDGIKARRGVYDYKVVCDDTNNSAQDIDDKKLNVWLFVKPTQAIEFIKFTTVITRTGEDFSVAASAI